MIYITELRPPKKLSGKSSFLIKYSKYVPELLSLIFSYNKVKPYYYFEKAHEWEISCVNLKEFMDEAIKYDDITLTLVKDEPTLIKSDMPSWLIYFLNKF